MESGYVIGAYLLELLTSRKQPTLQSWTDEEREGKYPQGDSIQETMEGVSYELDNEAQFWGEIEEIINPTADTIDVESAIRNFIRFAASFRGTGSNHRSGH